MRAAAFGVHFVIDHPFRGNAHNLGYPFQGFFHVADPDRQCDAASCLVAAQGARLVESDPCNAHQCRRVSAEPCVQEIVGRAGFAREVLAAELRDAGRGAVAGYVLQHAVHDERVAGVDDPQRLVARMLRIGNPQVIAAIVDDALNVVRLDQIAAVGKHRIRARHLPERDRARAQRHGEVRGMLFGLEAEAGDVVLRVLGPDRLQDPDRHHVLRFGQRRAHAHGAFVLAVVVLRFPALAAGHVGFDDDRLVGDDRGRRKSLLQRSRIDERLERRPRLAPRLGDVVELAAVVVEAAHQRMDGAVVGVDGDESRLCLRQLDDLPHLLVILLHADDRTAADLFLRQGLVVEGPGDELEPVTRDRHGLARAGDCAHLLCVGRDDHCSQHVVVVVVVRERLVVVVLVGGVGEFDERLGAAIAVAPVVVEYPAP